MTADQINFILGQHGGKEEVIKHKYFQISFNNQKEYYAPSDVAPDDRINMIDFDNDKELVIFTENHKTAIMHNDYTPFKAKTYVPYDFVEEISIMEELSYPN